jgi:hypothetical protein
MREDGMKVADLPIWTVTVHQFGLPSLPHPDKVFPVRAATEADALAFGELTRQYGDPYIEATAHLAAPDEWREVNVDFGYVDHGVLRNVEPV